jgi:hypothetical protein
MIVAGIISSVWNEYLVYSEHKPQQTPGWSNVMRGTICGNTINADWTDVPKGSIMQYLHVDASN